MQTLLFPTRIDSEADCGRDDGLAGDSVLLLAIPVRVCGGDDTICNIDVRLVHGQLDTARRSAEQSSRSLGRCRKEARTVDLATLYVND